MSTLLLSLLTISSLLFSSLHVGESISNEIKIRQPCKEPHFVLVHGYGGGAWSWFKIISRLEASGYNVTALDLKGSGTDLTNTSTLRTFDEYTKPLIDFMETLPDDERVILVGHSAGGVSVTDSSYEFSNKIHVAVYVAATMLKHGFLTQEDINDGSPGGNPDAGSKRHFHATTKSEDSIIQQVITKEDEVLKSILSRPSPPEVIIGARFKGNEVTSVKRVYIKTLYDQKLQLWQQNNMIKKWPPAEVLEVESGHEIIVTDPSTLSGLLKYVASCTKCN